MSFSFVAFGSTESTQDSNNISGDTNFSNESIEVTMDNWQEYFEIKDYLEIFRKTDAFGEKSACDMTLKTAIVPTENVAKNYIGENIAIELEIELVPKDFTYDEETFAFELDDCTCEHSADESKTITDIQAVLGIMGASDLLTYYQDNLSEKNVESSHYEIPLSLDISWFLYHRYYEQTQAVEMGNGVMHLYYPENIKVTRIQGTLEPKN